MDLKKKVGPLPAWAWVALIAGVGYLAWKRAHASSSTENEGVEEGWFPSQGIPAEGSTPTGGAGGGVTAAEEFLQHGTEAAEGRGMAFQEAAEGRQIAHEEAVEGRELSHLEAQENRETSLGELPFLMEEKAWKLAGQTQKAQAAAEKRQAAREKREAAKEKRAAKKHHEGKGSKGKGKRGKEGTNGNAGQKHHGNHTNHQPGSHAKTDHRPAKPARTRVQHPKHKARR